MSKLASLCVALLALPVVAQKPTPKPQQPKPQQPKPITKADRDQAIQLLRRHGEQSKNVATLASDYVQRRTTTLSKRPLLSSGAFLFVKKPAAVVFRADKPRASTVRLTGTVYEVYRPRRKRLERFHLDGPELSRGLFAAVSGDAEQLLKDFDVAELRQQSLADGAVVKAIRLVPKTKAMRKRLPELTVSLRPPKKGDQGIALRAVSYRDRGGDLIEIELHKLRVNAKDAPSANLDVPEGTRVIEHGKRQ